MRTNFINVLNNDIVWTGDLGVPIPRNSEKMTFEDREGTHDKNETWVVTDVAYRMVEGTGHSTVEVYVRPLKQRDYDPGDMARQRGEG